MEAPADYFDGKSSKKTAVKLKVYTGCIDLTDAENGVRRFNIGEVKLEPRVGKHSKRKIRLPDDACVEFEDPGVESAIRNQQKPERGFHALASVLENSWRWALGAAVVTVGFTLGFIFYGVPMMATSVAYSLPVETDRMLGQGALQSMDGFLFQPTALPEETQNRLRRRFNTMTEEVDGAFTFDLQFRLSKAIGANAFALPSGIVVVTDDLVALADNDEEILSILAHEIGHVVHRHSLRTVLQDSATGILLTLFLGDASSISAIAAGLPTVLVHAKYSRAFEEEADDYALKYLLQKHIPPTVFADIMDRLSKKMGESADAPDFLSSHPASVKRVEKFRQAAALPSH